MKGKRKSGSKRKEEPSKISEEETRLSNASSLLGKSIKSSQNRIPKEPIQWFIFNSDGMEIPTMPPYSNSDISKLLTSSRSVSRERDTNKKSILEILPINKLLNDTKEANFTNQTVKKTLHRSEQKLNFLPPNKKEDIINNMTILTLLTGTKDPFLDYALQLELLKGIQNYDNATRYKQNISGVSNSLKNKTISGQAETSKWFELIIRKRTNQTHVTRKNSKPLYFSSSQNFDLENVLNNLWSKPDKSIIKNSFDLCSNKSKIQIDTRNSENITLDASKSSQEIQSFKCDTIYSQKINDSDVRSENKIFKNNTNGSLIKNNPHRHPFITTSKLDVIQPVIFTDDQANTNLRKQSFNRNATSNPIFSSQINNTLSPLTTFKVYNYPKATSSKIQNKIPTPNWVTNTDSISTFISTNLNSYLESSFNSPPNSFFSQTKYSHFVDNKKFILTTTKIPFLLSSKNKLLEISSDYKKFTTFTINDENYFLTLTDALSTRRFQSLTSSVFNHLSYIKVRNDKTMNPKIQEHSNAHSTSTMVGLTHTFYFNSIQESPNLKINEPLIRNNLLENAKISIEDPNVLYKQKTSINNQINKLNTKNPQQNFHTLIKPNRTINNHNLSRTIQKILTNLPEKFQDSKDNNMTFNITLSNLVLNFLACVLNFPQILGKWTNFLQESSELNVSPDLALLQNTDEPSQNIASKIKVNFPDKSVIQRVMSQLNSMDYEKSNNDILKDPSSTPAINNFMTNPFFYKFHSSSNILDSRSIRHFSYNSALTSSIFSIYASKIDNSRLKTSLESNQKNFVLYPIHYMQPMFVDSKILKLPINHLPPQVFNIFLHSQIINKQEIKQPSLLVSGVLSHVQEENREKLTFSTNWLYPSYNSPNGGGGTCLTIPLPFTNTAENVIIGKANLHNNFNSFSYRSKNDLSHPTLGIYSQFLTLHKTKWPLLNN